MYPKYNPKIYQIESQSMTCICVASNQRAQNCAQSGGGNQSGSRAILSTLIAGKTLIASQGRPQTPGEAGERAREWPAARWGTFPASAGTLKEHFHSKTSASSPPDAISENNMFLVATRNIFSEIKLAFRLDGTAVFALKVRNDLPAVSFY